MPPGHGDQRGDLELAAQVRRERRVVRRFEGHARGPLPGGRQVDDECRGLARVGFGVADINGQRVRRRRHVVPRRGDGIAPAIRVGGVGDGLDLRSEERQTIVEEGQPPEQRAHWIPRHDLNHGHLPVRARRRATCIVTVLAAADAMPRMNVSAGCS